MNLLLPLLQQMSVFAVIAYLYSKTSAFETLLNSARRSENQLFTYIFFSSITIAGSYMGLPIQDALANTRAIGAVIAGLIGGPLMGLSVGFTAGVHRYWMGGFTAGACGLSTTVEGLIGGVFHYLLIRQGKGDAIYSYKIAFLATFLSETVQMIIIMLVARPFQEALDLVRVIAIPMTVSNSLGAALFISILRDQKTMIDEYGVLFSKKALRVAEKSIHLLSKGLSGDVAGSLARMLKDEIGVSAVAVTDRNNILAFEGAGGDHHHAGGPISSPLTLKSIETGQVLFVDGVHEAYRCYIKESCPLNSVLVIPLVVDDEVLGTIKLYESKSKRFLNINKSFGEGIVNLLSTQLLNAKYGEQKSLLVETELKLLQAQINPHFLFNTLNTILLVTRVSPDKAIELIQHLSNMFRKNLKRQELVSRFEEELDHVSSYLIIEKARFGERLSVNIDVDPTLYHLRVPTFTLQPLLENAIKHGMCNVMGKMVIDIRVYRQGTNAVIEVKDNGGAFSHDLSEKEPSGLGLNIVDKRIKNRCGNDFGVHVDCLEGESTTVQVLIPLDEKNDDL